MTSRDHLPAELRWKAFGRVEAGQNQTKVVRWLNVSPSVVHRICRQFQATDSATRRSSQGRSTATMSAYDRFLIISARRKSTATLTLLRSSLAAATGRLVSISTVLRNFRKVVCMRGDQPFACRSRHDIGGTVCSGNDNMSTGRLINGRLFFFRMSPGLA